MFDTARFKYPPHWVDLKLLYEAISTLDQQTQEKRGLIMVSKKKRISQVDASKICLISRDH